MNLNRNGTLRNLQLGSKRRQSLALGVRLEVKPGLSGPVMNLEEERIFPLLEVEGDFFLVRGSSPADVLGKNLLAVEENLNPIVAASGWRSFPPDRPLALG